MAKKRVKVANANAVVEESPEVMDGHLAEVDVAENEIEQDPLSNGSVSDGSQPIEPPHSEEEKAEQDVLADLEAKLATTHQEAQEHYDKYLRMAAEFENFKKRAVQERSALIKYSEEHIARDLLEVVDQLQLAVETENKGTVEEFGRGVEMVLARFLEILDAHQVRGESAVGQEFDPRKHEALTMVQTADHKAGTVIQELKRPYFLKDKLLRPGQVVVAAEIPEAKAEDMDNEPKGEESSESTAVEEVEGGAQDINSESDSKN